MPKLLHFPRLAFCLIWYVHCGVSAIHWFCALAAGGWGVALTSHTSTQQPQPRRVRHAASSIPRQFKQWARRLGKDDDSEKAI